MFLEGRITVRPNIIQYEKNTFHPAFYYQLFPKIYGLYTIYSTANL